MASTELKIDGDRLWETIQGTAKWGAMPDGTGMCRLSCSDEDKAVREWFVEQTAELGCMHKIDEMGNIFAIYPGTAPNLPPIGMGSHLDTQPAGGRYDGILGVTAALEVLRTIHAAGYQPQAPLAAIDWTNEEGARFRKMCCGSSVWSGSQTVEDQHALQDLEGIDMKSELQRIRFLGKTNCSYIDNPLAAHFELHIEQGPILEKEGKKIGIVSGVQAMRWYKVAVQGREGHAGATPMDNRADALLAAAKLITIVNTSSVAHGAVGTVGIVKTATEAVNTIVGNAWFSIDLRSPKGDSLDAIEAELRDTAKLLSVGGLSFKFEQIWECPAVRFDKTALSCVRAAAEEYAGVDMCRDIESAAGHDSAETSMRVPTAMIFVPSKDGISHNPNEYTSKEECADGAQVLLKAVLKYDALLGGT